MKYVTYMTTAAIVVFVSLVTGGCSTDRTAIGIAEDEAKVAQIKAQEQEKKAEHKQAMLENEIAKTPDWALNPPRPDATGMYAVGSADSGSLRLSVAQAKLRAEFGLAGLYKKELTGSERDFQRDSGGDNLRTRYQSLIDELVKASIVGEETVKQKTQAIHGRAYAWVLMKLPYDEFNKVLKEQRMSSRDKTIRDAFDDLERRVDKRRKQNIESAQIRHNMTMDELQKRNDILLKNQKATEIHAPSTVGVHHDQKKHAEAGKPKTQGLSLHVSAD